MIYKWADAENTILVAYDTNSATTYEPHMPEFATLSLHPDIEPYTPPPEPTPEEALAAERATMICTPAQMRLTLHRLGIKDDIQAIADNDPEAGIVWEYATQIYRQSPFIAALENADYTPERIDEIFRAAMQVQV
jgi:hypothetical protein